MPSPFMAPGAGGGLGALMANPGGPPAKRPLPMGPMPGGPRQGPVGPPPAGARPMFPPPAPRGPAGEVPPDSRSQPSPTEGGLGAMLGGPPSPLGAPPAAPLPGTPPTMPAPRGPTQPDASGVVPPPNTPGYAPLPMPVVGPMTPSPGTAPVPGGPGRLGAAIRQGGGVAPPPGAGGVGGMGALMGPLSAPTATTAEGGIKAAGAAAGPAELRVADAAPAEDATVDQPKADFSTPDLGKVVVPGVDVTANGGGSSQTYGDGSKKTDKGYRDKAQDAGFDVFDEEGALTKLPIGTDGGIDPAFLAAIGLGNNPKMAEKMSSLPDLFREWTNATAGHNDNVARQAQTKILDALSDLKRNGLDLKPEDLFNYYSSGEGKSAWAPKPGDPVVPEQDPLGIVNGVVDPDTGAVDLGSLDLDTAKAGLSDQFLDWLNKNPENGKAILDYLGGLQSRDDRQTAIDSFQGGLGNLLDTDPTRQAMYDYLGEGPNMTYDPATIEKMKMDSRQTYGSGVSNLDQQIREAAGARGIPTSDLAGLSVQGKMGLLSQLMNSERGIDITAAEKRTQDLNNYFQSLNAAQSSLLGPEQAYYGSLANLIAGTPGLAQTGNPLAGVAQFQLDSDLATQGPTTLDRIGAYAGIGGGIGSLLGGGASLFGGGK